LATRTTSRCDDAGNVDVEIADRVALNFFLVSLSPSTSARLPLAFLSPKIVSTIITGNQPVELTAHRLSRLSDLPLAWSEQSALLGI
jgi:hypothetical protein